MMDEFDVTSWRVLVVDDEPDSIEVVKMVLMASGAEVFEAMNGVEGLALYEQERPTLVLTDLSMPEMDGWQLLNGIRILEDGNKTPVIALTAHAMTGDREKVVQGGFDGYLSKPLKMFTLLDDLKDCMNNRS